MFRANLWAVLVTAASGCSGQGELEYYSTTTVESREASDAPAHRQLFDEKNHMELRASWSTTDGSKAAPTEALTASPIMDKANAPVVAIVPVAPPPPPVRVESISVHIGDIHHHGDTYVQVEHTSEFRGTRSDNNCHAQTAPLAEEDQTAVDEQCEQLRREHEARVEKWGRLFRED